MNYSSATLRKKKRIPEFICIGAMNCGTTSFYRYLDRHPEVCMSEKKETDFFLERTDHDLEWYRTQFSSSKVSGEASPNYTKYPEMPGVPGRMYELLPEAKLIYLVRDPVSRIVSHYLHNRSRGREHRSIDAVLSGSLDTNHYVLCSSYYHQLEQYLEYYSSEQILVVSSKKLREDRKSTLSRVFEFIGVDPTFYSSKFEEEHGQSSEKIVSTTLGRYLSGTRLTQWAKQLVPKGLRPWMRRLLRRPPERPELPSSLERRLIATLRDDVKQLRAFTGRDFRAWRV